jgi:hypothetical protein
MIWDLSFDKQEEMNNLVMLGWKNIKMFKIDLMINLSIARKTVVGKHVCWQSIQSQGLVIELT